MKFLNNYQSKFLGMCQHKTLRKKTDIHLCNHPYNYNCNHQHTFLNMNEGNHNKQCSILQHNHTYIPWGIHPWLVIKAVCLPVLWLLIPAKPFLLFS